MSETHWEVVEVVSGPLLPEILCGLLKAQGIPAIINQEGAGKAQGIYLGPLGESEILVPSSFLKRAQEVMDLYYAGAFEAGSDLEDEEEPLEDDSP